MSEILMRVLICDKYFPADKVDCRTAEKEHQLGNQEQAR